MTAAYKHLHTLQVIYALWIWLKKHPCRLVIKWSRPPWLYWCPRIAQCHNWKRNIKKSHQIYWNITEKQSYAIMNCDGNQHITSMQVKCCKIYVLVIACISVEVVLMSSGRIDTRWYMYSFVLFFLAVQTLLLFIQLSAIISSISCILYASCIFMFCWPILDGSQPTSPLKGLLLGLPHPLTNRPNWRRRSAPAWRCNQDCRRLHKWRGKQIAFFNTCTRKYLNAFTHQYEFNQRTNDADRWVL